MFDPSASNHLLYFQLQEAITYHMCSVVQIIGPFAKEFASEIVDIITTYWNFSASHIVQRNCIRLAGAIAKAIKTDFRPSMPRLVPCVLRSLKQEMVDENLIAVRLKCLFPHGYSLLQTSEIVL